jgi:hypothetical protein
VTEQKQNFNDRWHCQNTKIPKIADFQEKNEEVLHNYDFEHSEFQKDNQNKRLRFIAEANFP